LPLLEPMIAHGSRMSWAGILRPGNEFAPALRSQLAVMTEESGQLLERYFGKWNASFKRFTTNLTSARIRVEALEPGQRREGGIMCVLHWVDPKDMVRSDKGSVCYGDGWPVELWDSFTAHLGGLPGYSVGEKLKCFLDSDLEEATESVKLWRARVRAGAIVPPEERTAIDEYWLPVPARLTSDAGPANCIVSWSPGATFYRSISEALGSREASKKQPDLANQAKYYLECTLAKMHGVRFESGDFLEDVAYERTEEYQRFAGAFEELERQRISNPRLGALDRFAASR
jgi:hypothetical protein